MMKMIFKFKSYDYGADDNHSLDEYTCYFNTLRPKPNGRHFPDNIFKCIFLNENVWIPIKISVKFVPEVWINNIPALVRIIAWYQPGASMT